MPAFNAPAEESNDPLANVPTQYSADVVITRKAGPSSTGHVYVDGNKRRTDRDMHGGIITIRRGDLDKNYTLSVKSKTYIESPLNPKMLETGELGKRFGTLEKVGTEEVNGELSDKYHFGSDTPNTAPSGLPAQMGHSRSGFIWVGQTTHMLVKLDNQVSTTEWKNIKLEPPDASVFEIPADYKKSEQPAPAVTLPSQNGSFGSFGGAGNVSPNGLKSGGTPFNLMQSGNQSPSPSASPSVEKPDQ
jgi:hypothetical protein